MSQFEQDFLASHNTYREKHGAPPLQLNRDICNSAQNWADYLLSIHTMKHSGGNVAVDAWYNEIKDYDFNNPEFSGTTENFTQVVWKASTEVGVGMATDGNGIFYVVGQYNEHGNGTNPGSFQMNVLPLGTAPEKDP
ncbi:hypothetical protein FKM82_023699 [Ascaphus truei]